MDVMDTLKSTAAGLAEKVTGENPRLMQEVLKLVQNMPDGVAGLMKQFQDKGLSSLATALTDKGVGTAISPDQILKGFGEDRINALALSSGLDPKVVPEKLANLLPKVIEKLTPAPKIAGVM
jgi:uncharacterized protein YidB (DUF937 family)